MTVRRASATVTADWLGAPSLYDVSDSSAHILSKTYRQVNDDSGSVRKTLFVLLF